MNGKAGKRGKDATDFLSDGEPGAAEVLEDRIDATPPAVRRASALEVSVMSGAERHYTDLGNARRLVAIHGRDLRYCQSFGAWFFWDGRRWLKDESGEVFRRAKRVVLAMCADAARMSDDRDRKAQLDHERKSESESRLRAMIAVAESEPEIAILPGDLDRDPWLLNVDNGTIDLRTGEIREHRREDLITRIAGTKYVKDATCSLWNSFLETIMRRRKGLVDFLRRLAGYLLTGVVTDHLLVILHGGGANGKTTLIETLATLLGEYAERTSFATFLARRNDDGPRNDIAKLKGSRLAYASESGSGRRLDEALVKAVTGGDRITARFLYGENFTFDATFKVVLCTNNRPVIRDRTRGMWRRLKLVPFDEEIPEEKQDRDLAKRLGSELPGILNWALEGLAEYLRSGLGEPVEVRDAIAEYREEQDPFGPFLDEKLAFAPDRHVSAADVWAAYGKWCEAAGEDRRSRNELAEALRSRGATQDRTGKVRWWLGVGLASGDGTVTP